MPVGYKDIETDTVCINNSFIKYNKVQQHFTTSIILTVKYNGFTVKITLNIMAFNTVISDNKDMYNMHLDLHNIDGYKKVNEYIFKSKN